MRKKDKIIALIHSRYERLLLMEDLHLLGKEFDGFIELHSRINECGYILAEIKNMLGEDK